MLQMLNAVYHRADAAANFYQGGRMSAQYGKMTLKVVETRADTFTRMVALITGGCIEKDVADALPDLIAAARQRDALVEAIKEARRKASSHGGSDETAERSDWSEIVTLAGEML